MCLRNHLSQVLATAGLGALLLSAGCGAAGGSGALPGKQAEPVYASDPGAVTVTGTENFYADVLHQIGGAKLKIYSFLSDPSADPHQYESNAADARAVADSRLVIENGLGYDTFMDKLLKASPRGDRVVIDVQRLVGARDGDNVHLWYDPTVMPRVARAAAEALVRIDSANAATYQGNLARFTASMKPLDAQVALLAQRYPGTPIAFTEPVFEYMARAIGLSVRSPEAFMKAVEEGNDPPAQAVARQDDLITQRRVKVLIYNSQTVTKVTSRLKDLALGNGVPVLGVAELAPPGMIFQDWQLDNLERLQGALAG